MKYKLKHFCGSFEDEFANSQVFFGLPVTDKKSIYFIIDRMECIACSRQSLFSANRAHSGCYGYSEVECSKMNKIVCKYCGQQYDFENHGFSAVREIECLFCPEGAE